MSQQEKVIRAISPGDLVCVRTVDGEYLCSVGFFTYGPVLVASTLLVKGWREVALLPPF